MTTKGPIRDYARVTKLYTNDGAGHFTEMEEVPFESVYLSSVALADYHADLFITGGSGFWTQIMKLYLNDGN